MKEEDGLRGLLSSLLSFILLVLLMVGDYTGFAWFGVPGLRVVLYVIAFLPVGLPVVMNALREMRAGDAMNEYFLMSLATVGAFCIGEYPEAVGVMLFYSVGESLQDKAVGKAHHEIESLVSLTPDRVKVVGGTTSATSDGQAAEMAPGEVKVGWIIEVPAGGRVPLDGVLLDDEVQLDTAALTGESLPRRTVKGNEVQAGAISLDRCIRLRVTHPLAESSMSRIMAMVEDAASRKSQSELFIRRFARIYTPVVIVLAVLVAFVPPLLMGFGEYFQTYLYRALVFLVVSCPCALVISIPLGYFSGLGVASRRGILFKGSNYLDAVSRVGSVFFDKTGTLTEGRFSVSEIRTFGVERAELLALVAGVEEHSTHPLAVAVCKEAEREKISPVKVDSVEEVAGQGIRAKVGDDEILVGNRRLLGNIVISQDDVKGLSTQIMCARNGKLIGIVSLSDTPKPDARVAFDDLRKEGVTFVGILSGDKPEITEALGRTLGADEAVGGLLPGGKMEQLKRHLGEPKHALAFVGDGINDAPCLALADVGVAMGGTGSDVAVETADVVIPDGQPSKVAEAVRIGRFTRRTVKGNIVLAIGVKVAVLVLGFLGLAGLWAAIVADTGVALLCVLNVFIFQKLLRSRLEKE